MTTGRRILVVDDNPDAADAVAVLLQIEGHEVHTAHSGRAALAEARTWRPDTMVLDIGLPDMDGYELARQVMALRMEPTPLLIALSGYGRAADIRLAREAGFAHHLLKPVEPDALFAVVQADSLT
jgi:CheY-like chemotaxis protein